MEENCVQGKKLNFGKGPIYRARYESGTCRHHGTSAPDAVTRSEGIRQLSPLLKISMELVLN